MVEIADEEEGRHGEVAIADEDGEETMMEDGEVDVDLDVGAGGDEDVDDEDVDDEDVDDEDVDDDDIDDDDIDDAGEDGGAEGAGGGAGAPPGGNQEQMYIVEIPGAGPDGGPRRVVMTRAQYMEARAQFQAEQEAQARERQAREAAAQRERRPPTARQEAAEAEAARKREERLQDIRVQMLRVDSRLGKPDPRIIQRVMYMLEVSENMRRNLHGGGGGGAAGGGGNGAALAEAEAERLDASENPDDELDFGLTILLLGKRGVGKTATIRSLLELGGGAANPSAAALVDEGAGPTGSVRVIRATVLGLRFTFVDTPGLEPGQGSNKRNVAVLHRARRACRPDIVLYVDRLDASRDPRADLLLLRAIHTTFGMTIWQQTIALLTNASKSPPDGADGRPINYEQYEEQRGAVINGGIRQAAGDMRVMVPVTLAENHPLCRRNRNEDRVLPNGVVWCRKLLHLSCVAKLNMEANAILQHVQKHTAQRQQFRRAPPVPWVLSQMLQPRKPRKPKYEFLNDAEDFRRDPTTEARYNLTRDNIEIREEIAAMKAEEKAVREGKPVPAPLAIPMDFEKSGMPTFDAEQKLYRYRTMNVHDSNSNRWFAQPISEQNVYDHESGMDSGVSVSKQGYVLTDRMCCHGVAQVSKDKGETKLHNIEGESSLWLTKRDVASAGFSVMTVSKGELAMIFRANMRSKWHEYNRLSLGANVTKIFGGTYTGLRLEDKTPINLPLVEEGSLKAIGSLGILRSDKGQIGRAAKIELRLLNWPFGVLSRWLEGLCDADSENEVITGTFGVDMIHWRNELNVAYNTTLNLETSSLSSTLSTSVNPSTGQAKVNLRLASNELAWIGLLGVPSVARTMYARIVSGQVE